MEETRHLVGVGPARAKKARDARSEESDDMATKSKTYCSAAAAASEEESRRLREPESAARPFVLPGPADDEAKSRWAAPGRRRRACNWLRLLFRSPPLHPPPDFRPKMSRSEIKALNHDTMLQCLQLYNAAHPGDEYEPAPGKVTRRGKLDNYGFWTHGNFVARRKCSGCLSFVPAPRTLFFFELIDRGDDDEVLTCIPLDEPVTEAYVFLGIPLGRGTRRNGESDCVCKTCYRRFHVPHAGLTRKCGCEDSKVERVCKMCYLDADVLHPFRGGFRFGHHQEIFEKRFCSYY
ncbi:hypothetical protein CFC21_025340 [Triticum aestivum]|uniref:DUF3615 domain-containing protein n=3 Tax=Triticum TaxID=4564 RepID=A0A9R1RSE5_TRITD|nr:uncharacterized protein LOC123042034 [Triticum aestivum]KAF7010980.1 hypothetical protein CFC21_025340 [Triticum aestivum]VAH51716.1 unnamed protein product [Triticum turgidum subsp. durum]